MHDRRSQRMLARRPFASFRDRLLELVAVDLDAAADGHVVDRNARVLAQQVVGVFGDLDVPDHGAEYRLAGGVGLAFDRDARSPA
jgi:acetyl-CoA acetyltransferase